MSDEAAKMSMMMRMAELSRLDPAWGLPEAEIPAAREKLARRLDDIVNYMGMLNRVDVTGVEPLYFPALDCPPPRPDCPLNSGQSADIMKEAPERSGSFFVVPRIL